MFRGPPRPAGIPRYARAVSEQGRHFRPIPNPRVMSLWRSQPGGSSSSRVPGLSRPAVVPKAPVQGRLREGLCVHPCVHPCVRV